jgi:hypothetical protein
LRDLRPLRNFEELMWDVHARFSLEGKITRTVTDNGENFIKSFRKFGPRSGLAVTAHRPPSEYMDDVEEVLPSQPQPQPLDWMGGKMELVVAMTLMTSLN